MIKYKKLWGSVAFFLGFLLVVATGAHSASLVTNLSLEKKGDFTYFTIFAQDKIEFNHFILAASNDRPNRIVVDLEDAIHKLSKYNFPDLPQGTVKAIRTSQYKTQPQKITRIVLDLKEPVVYKVVDQDKENRVILCLSTKKDPAAVLWAADPKALKTKIESPEKVKVKKEDKKEFVSQKPVSPVESKPSKTEKKSETEKQKTALAEKPKDIPTVKEKADVKKTESAAVPTEIKKKEDKKKVSKAKEIEPETSVLQADEVAAPSGKQKDRAAKASLPQPVYVRPIESSALQGAAGPRPEDQEEGVAQRESLAYISEGRRDPFIPVSEEIDFEFGEIPLPSVENLKLVGTLEDHEGYKALLEDDVGYGYLLKSGDKVKNGFVVDIFKNKIVFEIEEYGWSRVISLELTPEY